jgi:hypothetical protein
MSNTHLWRWRAPAAVAAAGALLSAPAFAQQLTPRTPGLWQVDSQVQMSPLGVNQRQSEKLCLTPALAQRDGAPASALQDDGWRCQAKNTATGAGRLAYTLDCRKDADRAKGTGEVVLTGSKQFDGKSRIEAQMEGMAVVVVASYSGRFLGAVCGSAPLMKWEGVSEAPRKPAPAGKEAAPAK